MAAITSAMKKSFAKGLATGVGKALGGNIVNGIFGALGILDQGQEQMNEQLSQITGELKGISSKLGQVIGELEQIKANQHIQIIQKSLDQWGQFGLHENFSRIFTLWTAALDGNAVPKVWQAEVMLGPDSAMSQLAAIRSSQQNGAILSPLVLYANLIVNQIEYGSFPYQSPWIPATRFYNYCTYVVQNCWYAALMAKSAHLENGFEKEAEGCVTSYLNAIEEMEPIAFEQMVRILSAVNMKYGNGPAASYAMLYNPFFVIQDFQLFDMFEGNEGEKGWKEYLNSFKNPQYLDKKELEASIMGKEIELLDELFADYRPVLKPGANDQGRIHVYLTYWADFYDRHNSSQRLDKIQLLNDKDERIDYNHKEALSLNLNITNNIAYNDPRLDSTVNRSFYNSGNTPLKFLRLVYFVPQNATYKVNEDGRLKWTYNNVQFSFMGRSIYHEKGVAITPEQPFATLRWSPWDGAYLKTDIQWELRND